MEFSLLEAQLGEPAGTYLSLHIHLNCLTRRSSKDITKTKGGSARNGTRVSIKARISSWANATITADGLHPWALLYTQGRHALLPRPGKPFSQSLYGQRKLLSRQNETEKLKKKNLMRFVRAPASVAQRPAVQGTSLVQLSTCYHRPPHALHLALKFTTGGSEQPHGGEPHQPLKQNLLFPDFPAASMEPANSTLPRMLPASLDFSARCLPWAQLKVEETVLS